MNQNLPELRTPEDVDRFMSQKSVLRKCKTRFIFTTSIIATIICFKIAAFLSFFYEIGFNTNFFIGAMIGIATLFFQHIKFHQPHSTASFPKIKRWFIYFLIVFAWAGFCGYLIPHNTQGEQAWRQIITITWAIFFGSTVLRTLLYFTNKVAFNFYGYPYAQNKKYPLDFIRRLYYVSFLDGRLAKYTGSCTLCDGWDGRESIEAYNARLQQQQNNHIVTTQNTQTTTVSSNIPSQEELLNHNQTQLELIRLQREEIARLQKLADKNNP